MHIFDNVYCYIDVNNGSAFESAGGCLSLTNKVTLSPCTFKMSKRRANKMKVK